MMAGYKAKDGQRGIWQICKDVINSKDGGKYYKNAGKV